MKNKWLHLRLSPLEHELLSNKAKRTTCRNLSEYCRSLLFNRPVITTYRNRSQDDLIQQFAALNGELSAIGNNLNQVTKKMHTLQPDEQHFWGLRFKGQAEDILRIISEIKGVIQRLAERWLR